MGGGQPVYGTKVRRAETRTKGLYEADGGMAIKKSNENPLMDVFYNGYFKGKAHELLHNPCLLYTSRKTAGFVLKNNEDMAALDAEETGGCHCGGCEGHHHG